MLRLGYYHTCISSIIWIWIRLIIWPSNNETALNQYWDLFFPRPISKLLYSGMKFPIFVVFTMVFARQFSPYILKKDCSHSFMLLFFTFVVSFLWNCTLKSLIRKRNMEEWVFQISRRCLIGKQVAWHTNRRKLRKIKYLQVGVVCHFFETLMIKIFDNKICGQNFVYKNFNQLFTALYSQFIKWKWKTVVTYYYYLTLMEIHLEFFFWKFLCLKQIIKISNAIGFFLNLKTISISGIPLQTSYRPVWRMIVRVPFTLNLF